MDYSAFPDNLNDQTQLTKLINDLRNNGRNQKLMELRDYYSGRQWASVSKVRGQTRQARSGRIMWKQMGDDPNRGFTSGELKVWNLIAPAIDTYAKYARGDENDNIKILVKRGTATDETLSDAAMSLFEDLDEFTIESVVKMSNDGVLTTKYTALSATGDPKAVSSEVQVMATIRMEEMAGSDPGDIGMVEIIDPCEIEPIYWKGQVRGVIRFYEIDKEVAKKEYNVTVKKKDPLYFEVWFIGDDGTVNCRKFIETEEITEGNEKTDYEFLPYVIQENADHAMRTFCLDTIAYSDTDSLESLQDEVNAFNTDLSVVFRNVALPMLKITDDFLKGATDMDMEKVKKWLQSLTTAAGTVLLAPLEKLNSAGPADSQVSYINYLLDQYYRHTGIPKSVFNSEGLSNIAAETLDNILQSLRKRVADKRTRVAKVVRKMVKLHLTTIKQWAEDLEIEVIYPDMYTSPKKAISDLIIQAQNAGLIPDTYASQKIIALLGDSENEEKILAQMGEENTVQKMQLEAIVAKNEMANAVATPPQSTMAAVNANVAQRNQDMMNTNGNNQGK